MRWMMAAGAVAALVGCGHSESTEQARADSSWEQAKDSFANAYDSVKSGVKDTAAAGKYAIEGAGNGVVRVTDQSKQAVAREKDVVADSWITTKVKTKLAFDKEVKPAHLNVESERGVVHLYGVVDIPAIAERAIQLALDTDGVKAVDAQLQYRAHHRQHANENRVGARKCGRSPERFAADAGPYPSRLRAPDGGRSNSALASSLRSERASMRPQTALTTNRPMGSTPDS